jgi:putative ABC transport system permease protein
MNILEGFYIALDAIWSNKMRSFLTMLGLIIGIASVVTIVSLGNATQNSIEENLSSLGVDTVTIYLDRKATIEPSDQLLYRDIAMLEENFSGSVAYANAGATQSGTIIEEIDDTQVSIVAASGGSEESVGIEIIEGRFLNDFDFDGYKKNVVIDSELAEQLFEGVSSIGQKFMIRTGAASQSFLVVGVYEKEQTLSGYSSHQAYLPYTTMDMIYNLEGKIDSISVTLEGETEDTEIILSRIIAILEKSHSNTGEDKYDTFSAEDMIETVNDTLGMVTLFIGAIAGISLVVGGIGVMNIMLVSVTERTREIGIRKALGAQYKDIMIQFLIEAVTLALLGGIIGAAFGAGFTSVGGKLMQIDASVSVNALILAIVFSSSIGIFFGIYPANKAAKLDPIVALRHE